MEDEELSDLQIFDIVRRDDESLWVVDDIQSDKIVVVKKDYIDKTNMNTWKKYNI
jgi:hypothetical protein